MSKWGERMKKVEQLAQSFQLNPLAAQYKPRLWPCQPSSIWKLFPRQSMAISFTQSCKEAVHVFALEKEKTSLGQRIFLVTSYSELWHYYRTYPQSLMHCYEVIPEGAFHKPSNQGADGKSMVSSLIQYVCDKLMEVYGIECSAKNILNLDSSTEDKFSRHLIFNLKNAAFKDNLHMGKVYPFNSSIGPEHTQKQPERWDEFRGEKLRNRVCVFNFRANAVSEGTAGQTSESPEAKRCKREERDLSFLQVKNKDGQHCLFVDLGVYTKNRNFRLYKSSKVGKNAAFTVADDNEFIHKPEKGISAEESVFLASLVCNIGQRILTSDIPETQKSKTLGSPCQQESATDPVAGSLSGHLSSPYPEVDNFVLTVVKKDGVHGSKIVVDLKEEAWYQKCLDPECRTFRSSNCKMVSFDVAGYPLPQEICVSYIMTLDEEDQAYLMDDAGNIEPSQAPPDPPEDSVSRAGTCRRLGGRAGRPGLFTEPGRLRTKKRGYP
ncbi:hypothetical protein F7725_005712 [Dissostichus mawsoni]|uniref:DNA-directed primase/polymerase protein n=1 Tax=Dissostichus mawsoni TaxID=36200 RepID=A0A7J5YV44_DISMA|nr:hypothetical protein F7725_005712 [Dissostichus mawsoni]